MSVNFIKNFSGFRRESVAYGAGILLSSSLILNLLGICYRIVLARLVGAEGLAVYQLTISLYSILSGIALAGATAAVSQGAAALAGMGRNREIPSLLYRAIFTFFVLYTLLLTVILPLSPSIAELWLEDASRAPLIALLFPYMLLTGVENIYKALFLGLGKPLVPGVSEVLEQLLRILLLPPVLKLTGAMLPDAKAACLLVAMFLGEIFASTFMIIGYLRNRRSILSVNSTPVSHGRSTVPVGKMMLSIGLPITFTGLGIRIISSACSVLMPYCLVLSGLTQTEANQLYGTFTGMTMPLMLMCTALTGPLFTAVMPRIAKAVAKGDMLVCRRKCGKVIHITGLVGMPFMAMLLVCAEDLSLLMYGDSAAGSLCAMFVPCITLSMYSNAAMFLLGAMSENAKSGGLAVLSGLLQMLNLWLGPVVLSGGLAGYALLETFNDLLVAGLGIGLVCRRSGLRIMWRNWFVSPLLSSCAAGLCSYGLHRLMGATGSPMWITTLLCCGLLLAVYFLLLMCRGLRPKQYIRSMLDLPQAKKRAPVC